MKNKCTLLIDGNWLLQSRVATMRDKFKKDLPPLAKKEAANILKDLLARSITVMLNRFPVIDNIIYISDGGSWRKDVPIPDCLKNTVYKGNRSPDQETDWSAIYNAFTEQIAVCTDLGVTTVHHPMIEGDDWVWYWSRRLNSDGINCIIWSSDNDLKQLVQIDNNTKAFTTWYNDRSGMWGPNTMDDSDIDEIDFFMNPTYYSAVFEELQGRCRNVDYIDPMSIVLSKVMTGDAGDNIMPIARVEKNGRFYKLTPRDWNNISNQFNINNLDDLRNHIPEISKYISSLTKFSTAGITETQVRDMIDYNITLVWLNESVIPQPIILAMNQQEYKQAPLEKFKNNYMVLAGQKDDSEDIESIFDSI